MPQYGREEKLQLVATKPRKLAFQLPMETISLDSLAVQSLSFYSTYVS